MMENLVGEFTKAAFRSMETSLRTVVQVPGEADLDEIEKMQEEAMAGVNIINIIIIDHYSHNQLKVREQLMTEITGLEEQIGEMKTDIRHPASSTDCQLFD